MVRLDEGCSGSNDPRITVWHTGTNSTGFRQPQLQPNRAPQDISDASDAVRAGLAQTAAWLGRGATLALGAVQDGAQKIETARQGRLVTKLGGTLPEPITPEAAQAASQAATMTKVLQEINRVSTFYTDEHIKAEAGNSVIGKLADEISKVVAEQTAKKYNPASTDDKPTTVHRRNGNLTKTIGRQSSEGVDVYLGPFSHELPNHHIRVTDNQSGKVITLEANANGRRTSINYADFLTLLQELGRNSRDHKQTVHTALDSEETPAGAVPVHWLVAQAGRQAWLIRVKPVEVRYHLSGKQLLVASVDSLYLTDRGADIARRVIASVDNPSIDPHQRSTAIATNVSVLLGDRRKGLPWNN